MKTFDVVALGELLIDFTYSGLSRQGNILMEANPGGAPCNVLAMLTKLGRKTAFIGKVGNDFFGRLLKDVVEQAGIDASNLFFDDDVHTTLAFVNKKPDGDRDFSFYRNPGADMMLCAGEVSGDLISRCRIFHFGTLSMTHPDVRAATQRAVGLARSHGCVISFDPNLRESIWDSPENARRQIDWGLEHCDVLKISDNEILWFTGRDNFDEAVDKIIKDYNIRLVLLSKGPDGSTAWYNGMRVDAKAFLHKNTIETTGAGDTFCACMLNGILEKGLENLSGEDLYTMLRFANAAASLITTRKGALRVMPERKEIENLLFARNSP